MLEVCRIIIEISLNILETNQFCVLKYARNVFEHASIYIFYQQHAIKYQQCAKTR